MLRRAIVTGIGAVLPSGCVHPLLSASQQAAFAGDEQAQKLFINRRGFRFKDVATRNAACAAQLALRDAGSSQLDAERAPDPGFGVVAASCFGNVDTVLESCGVIHREGVNAVSPMRLPNASPNVVASTLALWFELRGRIFFSHGATAGLDALATGVRLIRAARASRVLVCAAEAEQPLLSDWLDTHAEAHPFNHALALMLEANAPQGGIAVESVAAPRNDGEHDVRLEQRVPELRVAPGKGLHSSTGLLLVIEQIMRMRASDAAEVSVAMRSGLGQSAAVWLRRVAKVD